MDFDQTSNKINNHPLFNDVPAEIIPQNLHNFIYKSYTLGSNIYKQGDPMKHVYFILQG